MILRMSYFGWLCVLTAWLAPVPAASTVVDEGDVIRLDLVRTDTPRDTLRTFYQAMEDYRRGVEEGNPVLRDRINDAVRTLNLEHLAAMTRSQEGRELAVLLKEVLDRTIVLDYERIPDDLDYQFWRLRGGILSTRKVASGDRTGEHLITQDTVNSIRENFRRVRHLPYREGAGKGAAYNPAWIEEHLPEWSYEKFAGVAYWQWIGLFFAILLGLTLKAVVRWISKLVLVLAQRTPTKWDAILIESVSAPGALLVSSLLWWVAVYSLRFEGVARTILLGAVKALFCVALIWVFYRAAGVFHQFLSELSKLKDNSLDDQIVKLISRSLKVFIVVVGVLLAAQNLGIQVFSVLAGLGIGGLAVALAAKDSLANFFGSIMIMFDRPFKVGHWIVIRGQEGIVEDIGFRSTKIRTFYNSLVSIPNSEVALAPVDNLGMRRFRRVRTTIGVTYDTPPEKIEAFLEGVKNAIKANPYSSSFNCHVVFNDFGPHSLDIMLYFFLDVPDWETELVQRQNILLEIVRLAKRLGVGFAFPTQTLHFDNFPEKKPVREPQRVDMDELRQGAAEFGPGGTSSRPSGSGLFTPPYQDPELQERRPRSLFKEGA